MTAGEMRAGVVILATVVIFVCVAIDVHEWRRTT